MTAPATIAAPAGQTVEATGMATPWPGSVR